jgi:hypothetical protein
MVSAMTDEFETLERELRALAAAFPVGMVRQEVSAILNRIEDDQLERSHSVIEDAFERKIPRLPRHLIAPEN